MRFLMAFLWLIAGQATLADDGYVGGEVCKSCHAGEYQAWKQSHHDLALQAVTPESMLGDFSDVSVEDQGKTTRFYRDGERFMVETENSAGEQEAFEVIHTFGVEPLQQYLVATTAGKLQALPWAWDARQASDGGQRWFHLYAAENVQLRDRLHWTQPLANWNGMCAECHSTNLKRNLDLENLVFETSYSDEDVNCEAYHGPGKAHVENRRGGKSLVGDILAWMDKHEGGAWEIAPGATTATWTGGERQRGEIETCAGCHSRRGSITDGFHAGEAMMDNFTPALVSDGLYHADGQIRDEVYVWGSFLQSKMYQKGVTCTDCHDPHTAKLRFDGNAVCTQCHVAEAYETPDHHHHQPESAGAQCASCHMPETTYMGVDPRRDHSIRVPRPDLTVSAGTPNACNSCHTDQSAQWAADSVETWSGKPATSHHAFMTETLSAAWAGDRRVLPRLEVLATRKQVPAIVRASAFAAMRGLVDQTGGRTLARGLRDSDGLVRMGAIRGSAGLPAPVRLRLLGPRLSDELRANRIEAARQLADVPVSAFTAGLRAARTAAGEELVTASEVGMWRGEAGLNLGQFHEASGASDKAAGAYRLALRADPYFTPARINLANVHRRRGDEAGSGRLLQEGLAQQPDDPELNHAWGLHLVRQGQHQNSLAHLEKAWAGAPENARYGYVYGAALNSLGQPDKALATWAAALQVAPMDIDILFALASTYASRGDRQAALPYAVQLQQLLPNDPNVRQLLNGLR